jgi:signal transduction histidine kinase
MGKFMELASPTFNHTRRRKKVSMLTPEIPILDFAMDQTVVPRAPRLSATPFLKYGLIIGVPVATLLALFPGLLGGVLRTDQFMPHAMCYLSNPKIIGLHVASDLLIGISYVSISGTLAYLVHKASRNIPFHWMFLAFGLFIITCGFTHFMEVLTVWVPVYWLAGYVKLICGAASVATALALYPLVPRVFDLIHEVRESQQRRQELQKANDELQAFAYSVSHDLRAPLRAVQGMALALTEDCGEHLEPAARQYLDRISGAAARMDTLVRDLLEYSRVSRSEFGLQAVDLQLILQEAQALILADAEQAGAEIRVEGSLPAVWANQRLLIQVLTNLLGNAIKFVRPGIKPLVEVSAHTKNETVRLSVADNGIGIAREYQGKVFGVFERLHSVAEYPGTGIGLAIVQKAMAQMKGTVGLESEAGKGSRFWIELRKADGPAPRPGTAS